MKKYGRWLQNVTNGMLLGGESLSRRTNSRGAEVSRASRTRTGAASAAAKG